MIFSHVILKILCNPSFINDDFDKFDEQDKLPDNNNKNCDDDDEVIWLFGYNKVSNFNACSFLFIVP